MRDFLFLLATEAVLVIGGWLVRFAQFVERPNVNAALGVAGVVVMMFLFAGARLQ
jgi:hypothetical protein